MKKCYSCGADVPDESKFCPKCGKPIKITQDLIDRAKANDSDAQTELYERTYKTVYSRIRAKVPDDDTAMDIMQEVYLNAFTNLDQLQAPESFPSWLLTIASRQVCAWYRKNGKENENVQMSQLEYENEDTISDEDDLLEQPEYREDFSPDESLDRAETGRLLSEILDTLPEDQRIILTMRYYDEMSLQKISDELGVNLSTVKTRLTAGKKKVEAKVLELEKSGTKLYSLGPVAFLVFLLHHAELFAPAISANTIIGLTAAGTGTAAGGAAVGAAAQAAAGVTGKAAAGAAVKAAGGVAAKGLGVKIAAAAAAAVVVAGGVTTAVVVSNSSKPEPPSAETVMVMAEDLGKWIANSDLGSEPINLDLDTACELSAIMVSECGYTDGDGITRTGTGDYDGYMSVISEDAMDQCLTDLFGSEYQSSDFQNEEMTDLIHSVYPDYSTDLSGYLVRDENGDNRWYYTGLGEEDTLADAEPGEVTDISAADSDGKVYTATVRYDWYTYVDSDSSGEADDYMLKGSADVIFTLKYDENSTYNWVITSIQKGPFEESDEHQIPIEGLPSYDDVYDITEPLSSWLAYAVFGAEGEISLNTNRAVELAGMTVQNGEILTDPISADTIESSLRKLFGSQYQLSDYTNTVSDSEWKEHDSPFSSEYPNYQSLSWLYKGEDGNFYLEYLGTDVAREIDAVTVKSIDRIDGSTCTAAVEYDAHQTEMGDGFSYYEVYNWSFDVQYTLIADDVADYGWAIKSFSIGDDYNSQDETVKMEPTEDAIHDIVDPLATWSVNSFQMYEEDSSNIVVTPTLNQAVELAAIAYFWEEGQDSFEMDPNGPVNFGTYVLPESGIKASLLNRFGLQYNLSDFTNTTSPGNGYWGTDYVSAFYPDGGFGLLCFNNGQYEYVANLANDGWSWPTDVIINSVREDETEENNYIVDIGYGYTFYGWGWDEYGEDVDIRLCPWARNVEYILTPTGGDGSGWAITQITYKDFYERDDL